MITDKNVLELMKLDLKSEIKITVNGTTNIYKFKGNSSETEDFELYAQDDKEHKNLVYGLLCNGIIEVIGVLIQDYANGIITDIEV